MENIDKFKVGNVLLGKLGADDNYVVGVIGTPTKYFDIDGFPIKVGDLVQLDAVNGEGIDPKRTSIIVSICDKIGTMGWYSQSAESFCDFVTYRNVRVLRMDNSVFLEGILNGILDECNMRIEVQKESTPVEIEDQTNDFINHAKDMISLAKSKKDLLDVLNSLIKVIK